MQQAGVESQLGDSYIITLHTENVGDVSLCNLDSVAHEYLKNHFNKRLNDKVVKTFKELFGNINTDSIKEAQPKVSVFNNIIAKYVKEINLKYGIVLSFMQFKASKVSTWAKTFQVATTSKDKSNEQQSLQQSNLQQSQDTQYTQQPIQLEQPQQTQKQSTTPEVVTMPPQCQASPLGDKQVEINRLTNMAA